MANAKRKVSAFGSAARPGGFTVEIDVADMLALEPSWTPEKARAFLSRHGAGTASAMMIAAARFLTAAAEREEKLGDLN